MEQFFKNKFHQVAIYHTVPATAIARLKTLGYTDWVFDEADLTGEIHGVQFESHHQAWFNYQWGPHELEFVRYTGLSWHFYDDRTDVEGQAEKPFLSHKSVYVDDVEKERERLESMGIVCVQAFNTSNHLNPYLLEKRQSFKEAVFSMRELLGFDVKLIQRVYG